MDSEMRDSYGNCLSWMAREDDGAQARYGGAYRRDEEWSFDKVPRQPVMEESGFHFVARAPMIATQPQIPPSTSLPGRLSLAPRNMYNRGEDEPRIITNAENHFRFAQNLRQGAPLNQFSPTETSSYSLDTRPHYLTDRLYQNQDTLSSQSPMTRLADAMLMKKPVAPRQLHRPILDHESAVTQFVQNMKSTRFNQSQPQKQQATPPFNLSSFAYSPNTQKFPSSSSPVAGQSSSPTVRISHRRAANRPRPSNEYLDVGGVFEKELESQWTTYQNSVPTTNITPQAITLAHAPPMAQGIQLVPPHELPDRLRQVFPYELFNAVQSKCFEPIYKTNDNVVVSAPTGSGKTALLELAICKLVEGHPSGDFKIVYQAPTKSLCSERLRDWEQKFSHLNLSCAELTGDTSQREMTKVRNASIIVTTPEKWDNVTRKWVDHHKLVQLVKLFLIDEVHILKDSRGATLEAVVSRMKTMGADVRFIALSATVPNSHDIAMWLGRNPTNHEMPAHRETFGEDFRPVKLQKHVHGFDGQMNDWAFEKVLDGKLPNLIQKYSQKKPIMVFCFTRKSCEVTASLLAEWWTRQRVVDRAWPAPTKRFAVGSKPMQDLVGCGVAFHHAGLDLQDRQAVEKGFLRGDISVICCTSTLAVGVNLPCHLVVLKGTVGYQDGILGEYSDLEVMQMLGRAGRPQFDDSAVAIIMTRTNQVDRYKKMIAGQEVLESTLHLNLIEHLNSEIGLGTIYSVERARGWLLGTFLSVRMRQNPKYYTIEGVPPTRDTDHRLEMICEKDIKLLQEAQLVTNAERFACTEYGQAMSRYMVQFETMKTLLSIPFGAKMEEILETICQASEFKDLRIKPAERPHLREFNKSPFIKYAIKGNVSTTAHKVSLIIQVQLGGIEPPADKNFNVVRRQFGIDKGVIFDRISRLVRCVVDCKSFDCDAVSTRNALDLARSLSAECWENSNLQLRQIPGVGPAAVRKLTTSNVNSVEKLAKMATADIERYMSKNPPYGRKMLDQLVAFPVLKLEAAITARNVKAGHKPRVTIRACLSYENVKVPAWRNKKPSLVFTAETTDGTLVFFWRGNVSSLETGFEVKFTTELSAAEHDIKCCFACEEIVGTMRCAVIKPGIPASAFPATSADGKEVKQSDEEHPAAASEFGEDDIADDDLLEAANELDAAKDEYDSDGFAEIDESDSEQIIRDKTKPRVSQYFEPVQMANGNWTCNHICRDGNPLKNGQTCKHKCCKDGMLKPRKPKPKMGAEASPKDLTDSQETDMEDGFKNEKLSARDSRHKATDSQRGNPKVSKKASKTKPKNTAIHEYDLDSVELIDLEDELPPVRSADTGPRNYRKLKSLHTSIQEDRPIRLPKGDPQFSYSVGECPNPPFLQERKLDEDTFDEGGTDDDDLPSPSKLLPDSCCPEISNLYEDDGSAGYDESIGSLEEGMIGLEGSMILRQTTPRVDSSFANEVFDFDAFSVQNTGAANSATPMRQSRLEIASSTSPAWELRKRAISPSLEVEQLSKHLRVSNEICIESLQGSNEMCIENYVPTSSSTPAWVDEFDADIVDGLRGLVEFID